MNEQKYSKYVYLNNVVSDSNRTAKELWAEISSFVHNNKLKAMDLILLNDMLKQLKNPNNNIPKKVLRSMSVKFNKIYNNYQR